MPEPLPTEQPSGAVDGDAVPSALPLVILSGPSGVGKTTVIERLRKASPVPLIESVSATTRPPRPGEVDGVAYYFLDRDDFVARRDRGEFLEWAEVHRSGYLYGTLLSELERASRLGGWALLEIDVDGAMNVLALRPDAVSIFIHATDPTDRDASLAEYERRLRVRGTEDEATLARRLQTTRRELDFASRYRHEIVNDDVERCVAEICAILDAERNARP